MTKTRWRTWGHEALEPGPLCPDDEELRLWAERTESAGDSASGEVGSHVRTCPRCRLEAEEIHAFFATSLTQDAAARDIETSLRATLASTAGSEGEQEQHAARFRPRPRQRAWAMAWGLAAATVVVASLVTFQMSRRPAIPSLDGGTGATRGEARPVPIEPTGEQVAIPQLLSWEPGQASGPWEVRLEQVDGVLLWSTTTSVTEVELPESVTISLRPGSRYFWQVQSTREGSAPTRVSFHLAPDR